MGIRQLLRGIVILAALAMAATPGFAGKLLPTGRPVAGATGTIGADSPAGANALCTLGITDPAASTVGYIIPDEDQYYTFIDPSECEGGAACGTIVSVAHIVLDFGYAMSTPVRVGLVAADLTDAGCPVPVPGSYVGAPATYDLVGSGAGILDIALPLGESVVLEAPVFLEITFTEWGPYWDVPGLVLTGACEPCRSFNYYPGNDYDLCAFGFEGNPVMYVEAECANPVREVNNSWGNVKALYR